MLWRCLWGCRLSEAGGRPALTGTWENAREGTRGAFACRLEEDPAASPAAPPPQPKAAQALAAVAEEASAAHYSGLWVGEARPLDEQAYDVPVRASDYTPCPAALRPRPRLPTPPPLRLVLLVWWWPGRCVAVPARARDGSSDRRINHP